jgi:hypothetical protein
MYSWLTAHNSFKGFETKTVFLHAGVLLAGYGAESHEFPHQAQIVTKKLKDGRTPAPYINTKCGSTIYNENWVITAA